MTTGRKRPTLMPESTPDIATEAWQSCMLWGSQQPKLKSQYKRSTGTDEREMPTAVEVFNLCNETEKVNKDTQAAKFIEWCNKNIWGDR
jgi:hypothetical protein